MAVDVLRLVGGMNLDDPESVLPKGHVRAVWNGIWRGSRDNRRLESTIGTNLVPNSQLPVVGVNMTIGAHYDQVGKRVFFFNSNSESSHGIYIYDTLSKTFQTLIVNGSTTDGDVLGFNPAVRINSADIIYGDNTTGDLLVFIDSIGRPTKLNIQRYLAGTYNPIKRSYLDVCKAPPRMPPRVTYENDQNSTVDNMRNSLFKFRTRYVYDDNDKSVYSTGSVCALPNIPFSQIIDSDPTKNCRMSVYFSTGDPDVTKIELWVQQSTDGVTQDWLLINSFNKSVLGLNNNDIYRFLFYNDGVYTSGAEVDILLFFDSVPLKAVCQALLNGNVIMYGGCTEGYNPTPINATVSTISQFVPYTTVNGVLFFAAQGGVDSAGEGQNITLYLTGTGSNDGSGNPTTIPVVGGTGAFVVDCATVSGSSLKFQYNNTSNTQNITTILNGLKAAAISQGFTAVSQTQNTLTLNYSASGLVLYYAQTYNNVGLTDQSQVALAYATRSNFQYAAEYLDEKGRTIGAQLPIKSSIQTFEDLDGTSFPENIFTIYNRPPLEARYWHLVRSLNLTYNKHLFWVSNSTFQQVDQGTGVKYAFINIANMADYNANIQASGIPSSSGAPAVVSYDFAPGDRIQFLQNIPFGTGSRIDLTIKNDYEILSVVNDPINAGIVQSGRFIKIQYPTADITPSFDFGGANFQNYKILIYNYVKHSTTDSQILFYEFGRTWAIGNAGTNNAFHIGSDQSQTASLSQPAIVKTVEGDWFWRERNVPAGNIYNFPTQSYRQSHTYERFITVITPDVIAPNYRLIGNDGTGGAQPVGPLAGDNPKITSSDPLAWNTNAYPSGFPISFRIRGTIDVTPSNSADHNGTFGAIVKVVHFSGAAPTIYTAIQDQSGLENPATYHFPYDVTFELGPADKAWLLTHAVNQMDISNGQQRIDVLDNIIIPIIEPSYSDKYNIQTNSNSRATKYDPNAGQFFYNTKVRWGQADQLDTNLNNSNRFYPTDFDEFDKQFGGLGRMIVHGRELRVFQERKCGHIGVYAKFIKDNTGTNVLVTVDDIISKNNVEYFDGAFGISNQLDGIATSGFQNYFYDPIRNRLLRLSTDGLTDISTLYKVQTFTGSLDNQYLLNYAYPFGGFSSVLGVYNFKKDKEGEVFFCFQGGTLGASSIIDQSLSFNEEGNMFTSFFNFSPDAVVCAEDILISFKNGQLYTHDNSDVQFYGQDFSTSIQLIFNDQTAIKKTYMSLAYQAFQNKKWLALNVGDITTSYTNAQTGLPQISQLIDPDLEITEGLVTGAFLRDANSGDNPQIALLEGEYLQGWWISVLLTSQDSGFNTLFSPAANWKPSFKIF